MVIFWQLPCITTLSCDAPMDYLKHESKWQCNFFNVGTPLGVDLFDHLLWPLFQSSIYTLHFTIFSSSYMFMVTFCGQLSCTASTPVFLTCGYYKFIFSENYNSRPCWDLNPGPPRYQAVMLPNDLCWLGMQNLCTSLGCFNLKKLIYVKSP